MKNVNNILITPLVTIKEAIKKLNAGGMQIVLVVNEHQELLGTVTDGDIRRGILNNVSLDELVTVIMNNKPKTIHVSDDRKMILNLMKMNMIHQLPIVDGYGKVVGIELLADFFVKDEKKNSVILMAGGEGIRLRPLTEDCPKPMLKVAGKPLLERIILQLIEYGFKNVYIAVNYKAEVIENYFGDGAAWAVNIRYLREEKKLGTVGAITLLHQEINEPLLVMNGDITTSVNFDHLLNFHIQHQSQLTICVGQHKMQIPYGVIDLKDHKVCSIREKPISSYFVNAGIYVINPEAISLIPKNTFFDMDSLIKKMLINNQLVGGFPLHEYWRDIGQLNDYLLAQDEYTEILL